MTFIEEGGSGVRKNGDSGRASAAVLVGLGLATSLLLVVGAYGQQQQETAQVVPEHWSQLAYLRGLSLFVGLAALVGTVKLSLQWRDGGLTAKWAISTFLVTVVVGFVAAAIGVEYFQSPGGRMACVTVAAVGAERIWILVLQSWDRVTSSDLLKALRGSKL